MILLVLVMLCAMGVVTSQHRARKYFNDPGTGSRFTTLVRSFVAPTVSWGWRVGSADKDECGARPKSRATAWLPAVRCKWRTNSGFKLPVCCGNR